MLIYRDGRFQETLEVGCHRHSRRRRTTVRVSVRPRLVPVPAQEVLTSEGLSMKISLVATCRTHDPRMWHEAVEDPDTFLYSAMQIGLQAVAGRSLDALTKDRELIGDEVLAAAAFAAQQVGISLDSVAVRDLMLPVEVRKAAAEVAIARSQGLAALERARPEVAATRASTRRRSAPTILHFCSSACCKPQRQAGPLSCSTDRPSLSQATFSVRALARRELTIRAHLLPSPLGLMRNECQFYAVTTGARVSPPVWQRS